MGLMYWKHQCAVVRRVLGTLHAILLIVSGVEDTGNPRQHLKRARKAVE